MENLFISGFSYDLEIRETSKNTIREGLQAPPNARQKKYGDFSEICPDPPKSQQLVQISSEMVVFTGFPSVQS